MPLFPCKIYRLIFLPLSSQERGSGGEVCAKRMIHVPQLPVGLLPGMLLLIVSGVGFFANKPPSPPPDGRLMDAKGPSRDMRCFRAKAGRFSNRPYSGAEIGDGFRVSVSLTGLG